MEQIPAKLGTMRKPDTYQITGLNLTGLIQVKGTRSIGEFFFRTGKGRFHQKDNYDSSINTAPAYTFPPVFMSYCLPAFEQRYGDPTAITFVYTQDPGHGWLGVPVWLVKDLGIEAQISRCSYISRDGLIAYLEEDMDMNTLINAFATKFGKPLACKERHQEHTFIRDLPGYSVDRFSKLLTPDS